MKRNDLLRHLHKHGCVLDHEGANHTIYLNPTTGHKSPVGRHQELDNKYCRQICKQLSVPII